MDHAATPQTTTSSNGSRGRRIGSALTAAGAALALLGGVTTMQMGANAAPSGAPPPTKLASKSGKEAADALGSRIDEAARRQNTSSAELRKRLESDPSLHIDDNLNAFYADNFARDRARPSTGSSPYGADRTFELHSRAGASRTIYLDFTGHTTSGTIWNESYNDGRAIVSAPYDSDGSPRTLSAAEHREIQNTWLRMREDFAPFDVDVTTEDPGANGLVRSGPNDASYGVRVIFSATTTWCDDEIIKLDGADSKGCPGGWASLRSFGGATDTPAFVFTDHNATSSSWMGEAGSHEVGHTLGLHHDGAEAHDGVKATEYYPGHGSWGPIMGSTYNEVTQWSRGEYAHATNKEDDFAVITANGLPVVKDDYAGSTATTATMQAGDRRYGTISTADDVDAFRFTLQRDRSLTIDVRNNNAGVNANLNTRVVVKNRAGKVFTTAVPAGNLGAKFDVSLPPGEYFVYVSGAGEGNPLTTGYSSYGSVGNYSIGLDWATS